MINLRPISWLKGARREFEDFPTDVRIEADIALTLATRGGKADTAKPFKGGSSSNGTELLGKASASSKRAR
jgi:phage-related protein